MDDLYRDYILDHYKQPRNFGELEPHDLEALEHNPLCGDELGVHIRVKDGQIEDLRFHGHGCAISQASASIASEELKGMSLEEVGELGADWMIELLGIPVSATRRKCALLNLKVVRGAVTGDHAWPPEHRDTIPTSEHRIQRTTAARSQMATTDSTRITKPSPIVEDDQGQLLARQGISREVVSELSKIKGEPDWMAEKRLEGAGDLRTQADPDVGPGPERAEPRRPRALLPPDRRSLQLVGRRPRRDEADLRGPRHPPGRARAPRRRRRRVAPGAGVRGPEGGVRQAGDPVLLDGHGGHRVPRAGAEILHEQVRPRAGQQVLGAARRRLVGRGLLLHPQGRQVRPAAAVLLPHGGGRRGHLRAHPDRRRRGLGGELHRGLHRADLLGQLDALRGRRDLRPRGREGALHDRAELVEGRLQPQHQARRRRRRAAPSSGSAARWARST